MRKIVLASASPRRKMLLEQLGLKFEIIVSNIEEVVDEKLTPEDVAKSLAYQKAKDIADKVEKNCLVIGSDTIVVMDNTILGKPKDQQDAFRMIKMLSGNTHRVITGVCVINTEDDTHLAESDISYIQFREISDGEIKYYVDSGEPMDKAGSYGIQGLGAVFIEKIEGSYTGVVGLPVFTLDKMLRHYGVNVLGGNKQ